MVFKNVLDMQLVMFLLVVIGFFVRKRKIVEYLQITSNSLVK